MKSFYFKRFALCLTIIVGTALTSFAQNVAKIGDTEYATLAEAVAAAGEGSTVTLLSSTDVSEMIPVTKSITLDLNGQTITNNVTANRLFRISDVTFTIEGNKGNIITPSTNTQSYGFVDFRDATGVAGASTKLIANNVSFEGGTNEGSLFAFRGNGQSIEFNNVDVNLTESYTYSIINGYQMSVSINIQGGSFICKSTHKTAGVFQAGSNSTINFSNVNVETCVGPIFQINANSVAVFENCTMKNTATDSYFATCIASAHGSEVNVKGGSYEANYAIYVYNSGGTINLDGGTYIGNIASIQVDRAYESDPPAIVNVSSGTFTGDVKNNGLNSEVKILDGTINGNIVNSGNTSSTTISGGTITGDVKATGANATITITDGEISGTLTNTGNASSISVTGGTFTNTNSNVAQYIDSNNTTSTDENGKTVVKSYVAQVGENKYLTLTDAATNANGTEIKLIYDVVEDVVIPENVNVVIDLNGKTITNKTSDTFTVPISSSLTINDNSEEKTGVVDNVTHCMACIYNNGTVTLNGGKFTRSKEASKSMDDANGNSYYNILNHGDMTINEGVTVFSTGAFSSLIASGYFNYTDTKPRSGYVAGTNKEAPMLVINGGKFSGGINTIKNDDNATAEIKGGTFENVTQHCVQNHNKLTISGGTFRNTGNNTYAVVWNNVFNSGVNVCNMTITGGTYDGSIYCGNKTTITDGTFNGDIKVIKGKEPEISGGTFVTDVTDYCVDGFVPVKGEDGTYTVETGDVYIANLKDKESDEVEGGFVSLSDENKNLELNHDLITKLLINKEFENVTVEYTRTYSANCWSDLFMPFDITLTSELLNDFSFAELWDTELVNDEPTIECLVMKEGDVISANTPYVIRAKADGEQTLTFNDVALKKTAGVSGALAADCSSIKQWFKFYGVYENTTLLDKKGYFLNTSENSSFYTVSDATASLSPMRFYMTVQNKADGSYDYLNGASESTPKSVKLKVIGGGEGTTGITDVNAIKAQGEQNVYTLQGTFVGKSTKGLKAGIYIVNGKKIIIK